MAVLHIFMTREHTRHNPDFTLLWGTPKNGVKALCRDHTKKLWKIQNGGMVKSGFTAHLSKIKPKQNMFTGFSTNMKLYYL